MLILDQNLGFTTYIVEDNPKLSMLFLLYTKFVKKIFQEQESFFWKIF